LETPSQLQVEFLKLQEHLLILSVNNSNEKFPPYLFFVHTILDLYYHYPQLVAYISIDISPFHIVHLSFLQASFIDYNLNFSKKQSNLKTVFLKQHFWSTSKIKYTVCIPYPSPTLPPHGKSLLSLNKTLSCEQKVKFAESKTKNYSSAIIIFPRRARMNKIHPAGSEKASN